MENLRLWTMACIVPLLWLATAISSPAQNYETLVKFHGANGELPYGSLVQGKDGNLYGTTVLGGDSNLVCELGCGTVFKITPAGRLTVLHRFRPAPHCPKDGRSAPAAGLVQSANGNFYGTTLFGGDYCVGTVFEITPLGKLTTIYSFGSQGNDGQEPWSGLVQGAHGDFYGTTSAGGTYGDGTVFKITPAGKLTILHSFCQDRFCTDGQTPFAGLVQGADGSFYGTTIGGGTNHSFDGVVFKITPTGKLTVLYSFCSKMDCTDGAFPGAALVLGRDGSFYGTTRVGGNVHDSGTVFKITPSGQLTTLYSFCSKANCLDGSNPYAGLVQGLDGDFYGATVEGGLNECSSGYGCGTVFKITPIGKLTTLHRFSSGGYATGPVGTLLRANNYFYGSTSGGGVGCTGVPGCGTVFRIRP
jgi:uncharacterized repeat protein (TIGR03803 family)